MKERPGFEVIKLSSKDAKNTTIAKLLETEFNVSKLDANAQLKVWGNATKPGSESEALTSKNRFTPKSSIFKLYNYVYGGASGLKTEAEANASRLVDKAQRIKQGKLSWIEARKELQADMENGLDRS